MTRNIAFMKSEATLAWVGQFDPTDQALVTEMLEKMLLVSRNGFVERLIKLIRSKNGGNPIGLYAERELRSHDGRPNRLFKQSDRKPFRAAGAGPRPIDPFHAYDADVGSEGIVAQAVSELCRRFPKVYFNHPGPDQIRKNKIRRFVLVTDFIGSGDRVRKYLDAAWRVASVRSWWSARATVGMSFEVIAYSATPQGQSYVEAHRTKPDVSLVAPCPTISNSFSREKKYALQNLCAQYSPAARHLPSTGYGWVGALIAFAHGAPNNVPLIFFKKSPTWIPLFPERVTSDVRDLFTDETETSEQLRERLRAMRQSRLSQSGILDSVDPQVRNLVVVLAALSRPPRTRQSVALQSSLTLSEVDAVLAKAIGFGWIDGRNRLTDRGQAELRRMRVDQFDLSGLPHETEDDYCPHQLRAPVSLSR
ncbi:phosphoribosyltransferase-like protein [Rhizobium laguerreae]|uniref:phosphoribosyltransferase-like protein n=1 Tax=Rhizobium laguerreae TaxID=1076926 RepID=UPI001C91F801|nr:hypothetical protein [Rhizobium laguerreae]MBY3125548.1 hypothetical protein [Rhizobium laguerreae]